MCTGQKSYGLRIHTNDGNIKHIIKAKVLTINEEMKGIVSFEKLLKLVIEHCHVGTAEHYESLYDNIKYSDVTVKAINEIRKDLPNDDDDKGLLLKHWHV